jgi:hypothetical protein
MIAAWAFHAKEDAMSTGKSSRRTRTHELKEALGRTVATPGSGENSDLPPAVAPDTTPLPPATIPRGFRASSSIVDTAVADAEESLARALTDKITEIEDTRARLSRLNEEARDLRLRLVIIREVTR